MDIEVDGLLRATTTFPCHWHGQHNYAVNNPRGMERAIVAGCYLLERMAGEHKQLYDAPIGEDGFMGAAWLDILRGLRAALNGETGRLDCGTVDRWLLDMLARAGFTEEEL